MRQEEEAILEKWKAPGGYYLAVAEELEKGIEEEEQKDESNKYKS